jgi:hypothetical protein
MSEIDAIRVLVGCGASGKSLEPDTVYTVPDEVSHEDAALLVRIGRAVPVESAGERKGDQGVGKRERDEGVGKRKRDEDVA